MARGKLGGGYNIHWFGLALGIGPYEARPDRERDDGSDIGERVLELVIEFLETVDGPDGRRSIYTQYETQRSADGLS